MGHLKRATVVLLLLLVASCDDVRRYSARGVVEDVQREQGQILIDHDDIPGLMPAMTMSFDVADRELLERLEPGQEISFTLVRTSRAYEIVDVRVLGMVEVGDEWAKLGEQLVRTTEAAPFALVDQDGRTVSSDDLRGRVLLLDFIFTQCPGPCPILTARHVRTQRALPDELRDRIQFVSISLDPENDTPDALRAYGAARGASFENWSFLGGDPATVDAVVRSYYVGKTRSAEGEIEHLVITFLIDGRGRILRRYRGTKDEAEMIADDLAALPLAWGAMAILKVARMGHPALREKCRALTPDEICSQETAALVENMLATMAEYGGVGLAAPQVHEPLRLALIEFSEDSGRYRLEQAQPLLVVFNARVTVLDDAPSGFWEGCLSVPGLRGYVERPSKIRVDYLDMDAREQSITAEGFLATVLQHELDHLDGVLYIDRIVDPSKLAFLEEYGRYHSEDSDPDPDPDPDSEEG